MSPGIKLLISAEFDMSQGSPYISVARSSQARIRVAVDGEVIVTWPAALPIEKRRLRVKNIPHEREGAKPFNATTLH
jgi:hypothetical protein